jgi:hypothetical protein
VKTALCRFTGGSLDGGIREVPTAAVTAATTEQNGDRSWYLLSDDGSFRFCGFNETGAIVAGFGKAFRKASGAEREAIEEAMRPQSCRSCGRTFGTMGAYYVHFEAGENSRCLPDGAYGQLIEVSGVWCIPGTDVARR